MVGGSGGGGGGIVAGVSGGGMRKAISTGQRQRNVAGRAVSAVHANGIASTSDATSIDSKNTC